MRAIILAPLKSRKFHIENNKQKGRPWGREMFPLIYMNGLREPKGENKQISQERFHAFFYS